ncbi:uncharacterized protein METZ01_LOCUS254832, partial [marine metagenome]
MFGNAKFRWFLLILIVFAIVSSGCASQLFQIAEIAQN